MKNLIPLLFLFLLSACHKVNEQKAIRRIINETDYRVEISIYGDELAESFQYEIMPKDSLDIEGSCFFGASEYCSLDWTTSLAFGEIIFQDSLRLLYEDLPSDCMEKSINGDPVRECYGYKRKTENGILIYSYRITSADIKQAKSLE